MVQAGLVLGEGRGKAIEQKHSGHLFVLQFSALDNRKVPAWFVSLQFTLISLQGENVWTMEFGIECHEFHVIGNIRYFCCSWLTKQK